jgi:hypothetical protein
MAPASGSEPGRAGPAPRPRGLTRRGSGRAPEAHGRLMRRPSPSRIASLSDCALACRGLPVPAATAEPPRPDGDAAAPPTGKGSSVGGRPHRPASRSSRRPASEGQPRPTASHSSMPPSWLLSSTLHKSAAARLLQESAAAREPLLHGAAPAPAPLLRRSDPASARLVQGTAISPGQPRHGSGQVPPRDRRLSGKAQRAFRHGTKACTEGRGRARSCLPPADAQKPDFSPATYSPSRRPPLACPKSLTSPSGELSPETRGPGPPPAFVNPMPSAGKRRLPCRGFSGTLY